MNIKDVVNDAEWQAIRSAMVGTWKREAKKNCIILETYLSDFTDPLKLRRVHNYLTGSGFRIGIISAPEIDNLLKKVRACRKQIHH